MIIDYNIRVVVEGGSPNPHYYRATQTDIIDETAKESGLEGSTHRDFVVEFTSTNQPTCVMNSPSDLKIRTNVGSAIVNDDYTATAHESDKKFFKMSLVRDNTSGLLEILAFTKTTGNYGSMPSGKTLEFDLKEFSVVAAGTVLVEEQSFI